MVEVFKTNVANSRDAARLLALLHQSFPDYSANFDLEDCDNILRVANLTGHVRVIGVIGLLVDSGFWAEVLSDEVSMLTGSSMVVSSRR